MKRPYIHPVIHVVTTNCQTFLSGSTGDAVNSNGTRVNLNGVRYNGDASQAAARSHTIWDDDE